MSIADGDNIRFNTAMVDQERAELEKEAARLDVIAAGKRLEREEILLQRARRGE
jgi:hypothetical protein